MAVHSHLPKDDDSGSERDVASQTSCKRDCFATIAVWQSQYTVLLIVSRVKCGKPLRGWKALHLLYYSLKLIYSQSNSDQSVAMEMNYFWLSRQEAYEHSVPKRHGSPPKCVCANSEVHNWAGSGRPDASFVQLMFPS